MSTQNSQIIFDISLDENHVPSDIKWNATDSGGEGGACDAILLGLWDKVEKNTLRIDLWTKDMEVHDMKIFFHQMMLSMADTFERATSEQPMANEMREFAQYYGEKMKLIRRNPDAE